MKERKGGEVAFLVPETVVHRAGLEQVCPTRLGQQENGQLKELLALSPLSLSTSQVTLAVAHSKPP